MGLKRFWVYGEEMKTTDSQIDYLSKRGKTYNYKYSILSDIMELFLHQDKNVIELFGGVGITSYFIQKQLNPRTHVINEVDDRCINALKEIQEDTPLLDGAVIKKEDSFFCDIKDYDIVFADSNFTKKMFGKFDGIFRNIKNTLVLTETGVFNLTFNKTTTAEDYFKDYQERFKKYGLYLHCAFYTHTFSIMLLKKIPLEKAIITKYTNENTEWKEYVKCISTP
jgi:hypothetical protein